MMVTQFAMLLAAFVHVLNPGCQTTLSLPSCALKESSQMPKCAIFLQATNAYTAI